MTARSRVSSVRIYEIGLQAEREGLAPGIIGNPTRLDRLRWVRSLERMLHSITGSDDVEVDVVVTSGQGGRSRQIELRISGPYSARLLRTMRSDIKRLKQAK